MRNSSVLIFVLFALIIVALAGRSKKAPPSEETKATIYTENATLETTIDFEPNIRDILDNH